MKTIGENLKFRSVFISDIHLGTRGCKAEFLLDFLRHTDSEFLYLVGDIFDGWRLKRNWFWPQAHNDVIQKLLRKARKGTKVFFVPGNHDEFARDYVDNEFGRVEVKRDLIHTAANGRRFLVTHGDECDGIMLYARWLAVLGDYAYVTALAVNHWFNVIRRKLKLPYWSLSAYLKHKVKNVVQFMSNYEDGMVTLAKRHGADGVICGHIHHAAIKDIDGILYCNDGDWVESCTALVEHYDGRMEILTWTDMRNLTPLEAYTKAKECEYSSSPTHGSRKSTVLSEP